MNHSIKDPSNPWRKKHLNKGLPKGHAVPHYLHIWEVCYTN